MFGIGITEMLIEVVLGGIMLIDGGAMFSQEA